MRTENGQVIPAMLHNKQTVQLRALIRKGKVSIGDRVCVRWGKGNFLGTVTGEYQHEANGYEIAGHVWIVTDEAGVEHKVCRELVWLQRVDTPKK